MLSMSGGRLAQSMSALPSAASTVGRMLHRHQTMTPQLAPPTSSSSSSPSTEDENGFVMLQPDKPASTTAVARYDFDGFGGQLSFRRGDEIVLLNYPPLATSSSSRQTPYASSSSTSSSSWCVGKRAMDGVTGIVYLPALKLPSSTPASPTSALASPTGPRRGRLFIIDHSSTKAREDEERVEKEHRGYDQYGNADVEDDEPPVTTKRKENYGAQVVGFVLVLLVLLFVLGCLGQAGWGLAVLGFLPRLASLLDRLVQRRFL